MYIYIYVQGIHKIMVRIQKLTRNLFLTLNGHNVHRQSGNCPSFSCATSSSLLMLTAGPRGQFPRWHRSKKGLSVYSVLRCQDQTHHAWCVFSKPWTLHCNHRSLFRHTVWLRKYYYDQTETLIRDRVHVT